MGETSSPEPWRVKALECQARRDCGIAELNLPLTKIPSNLPPNVTGVPGEVLSTEELQITESLPETLLAQMGQGQLTSLKVTTAFLHRAAIAQKLVNCVTELLPQRALDRARFLDNHYKEHGKPFGALHGLPISVKEHVSMKGLECNAGFVSWIGRISNEDSLLLQFLWRAGCVFYVRTTQPQTLMHLETSNNIFGVTVNPFNRALTSGGSSGGEGAILGMRGSCLGIGTDIGGSIRSPAANNGVYGLRPTAHRLPLGGITATMIGQEQIVPVVGPLSTSLEGIRLLMKTVIDAKPWLVEPNLYPLPWRDDVSHLRKVDGNLKIKIGVLWDDGVVKPHPPVTRALTELVDKLRGIEGVTIVDWQPYKHDLAWEIIASLYFSDGGSEEKEAMEESGEPWRPLTTWLLKENPFVKHHTISEVWAWTIKRDQYRADYAKLWNSTGEFEADVVDVILSPTGPGAAPILNTAKWWGYTSQWNILDYPALVFPVSAVDTMIDVKEESYTPRNNHDKHNYERYEPENFRDAPISLQLIARRFEDEKLVETLRHIESHVSLPFVKFY